MQALFLITTWIVTNFYSLQFTDTNGVNHSMSEFQGKKILLVNIATGSSRVNQLAKLQQLQQQYSDKLVVIGFPSNSFGNETKSDAEIRQFSQSQYGISFLLARKNPVSGGTAHTVYKWLTTTSDNGVIGDNIRGDFQKMLINEEGALIGIFSPTLDPLSHEIVNAIQD